MTSADVVPAVQARDLYRFFRAGEEETLALRGVSFTVEQGESVALMGPSGSGKSTLLACLAGLDEPAGGVVLIGGQRVSHRPEADRARIRARRVGVLMQTGNLLAHLNIRDNIRVAQLAGTRRRTRHRAEDLLDQVGLGSRRRAYPSELSGGELARAGLATALANDPDVLLADEPTGELDGQTEQQIVAMLQDRAGTGLALVVATHSAAVARTADRVIILTDGQVTS
jgi:putative ABC transport system ATP-binding protein